MSDQVTLGAGARQYYKVALYADPAVTSWAASFDEGLSWVAGDQVGTQNVQLPGGATVSAPIWRWLVRGPAYADSGTPVSTLITASVRPLLRFTDTPEQEVHRGPQITLRTP